MLRPGTLCCQHVQRQLLDVSGEHTVFKRRHALLFASQPWRQKHTILLAAETPAGRVVHDRRTGLHLATPRAFWQRPGVPDRGRASGRAHQVGRGGLLLHGGQTGERVVLPDRAHGAPLALLLLLDLPGSACPSCSCWGPSRGSCTEKGHSCRGVLHTAKLVASAAQAAPCGAESKARPSRLCWAPSMQAV